MLIQSTLYYLEKPLRHLYFLTVIQTLYSFLNQNFEQNVFHVISNVITLYNMHKQTFFQHTFEKKIGPHLTKNNSNIFNNINYNRNLN